MISRLYKQLYNFVNKLNFEVEFLIVYRLYCNKNIYFNICVCLIVKDREGRCKINFFSKFRIY